MATVGAFVALIIPASFQKVDQEGFSFYAKPCRHVYDRININEQIERYFWYFNAIPITYVLEIHNMAILEKRLA